MPANMKCGRLRASNCFEVFFPPPLPLPLIRPPPPQPPRPLFLSSSLFPPFHRDSTFLSTACINKCALSFSSSRFPLDFFISSFFIERRQRERKRGFLASVLFTTDSPSPLFIVVSTVLFFFYTTLFALERVRVDRSSRKH